MISLSTKVVVEELNKYSAQVLLKLRHMVAGFSGEIAETASMNTSIATPSVLESMEDVYEARRAELGIEISPGFHAGAWKFSHGAIGFDSTINPQESVGGRVSTDTFNSYKLGETFAIGAIGPNYDYLQERDNIMSKTTEANVLAAYSINLKGHYDEG